MTCDMEVYRIRLEHGEERVEAEPAVLGLMVGGKPDNGWEKLEKRGESQHTSGLQGYGPEIDARSPGGGRAEAGARGARGSEDWQSQGKGAGPETARGPESL